MSRAPQKAHFRYFPKGSISSPVAKLPDELLAEIFVHCSQPGWGWSAPPITPLKLSHVCAVWRCVALTTPVIWTDIKFRRETSHTAVNLPLVVNCWIPRSGRLPLYVELDLEDGDLWNAPEFRSILYPTFPRWRALDITCKALEAMEFFASFMNSDSSLESFELNFTGYGMRDPFDQPWQLFHRAPCLRRVSMLNILPFRRLSFPWSQLHELAYEVRSYPRDLEMLPSCSSLRTLQLRLFLMNHSLPNLALPISLPSLRELSFLCDDEEPYVDWEVILSLFQVAGLESLRIQDEYTSVDLTHVRSFIARSSCSLRKLELDMPSMDAENIALCLESTPLLTELSLHVGESEFPQDLFPKLSYKLDPDIPCLLPRLERLHLDGHEVFDDLLLEMVHSRLQCRGSESVHQPRSRLRFLRVGGSDTEVSPAEAVYNTWRDEGLQVVIGEFEMYQQ